MRWARLVAVLAVLCVAADVRAERFRALVFSRTTGFRHVSIPDAVAAIQALGAANDFGVDATEDPATFTPGNLTRYAAVVFVNTTGDVLDAAQQTAVEHWYRAGGGFVGVHSAADTEYDWAWYGDLVGARFRSHPAIQDAVLDVEDAGHPSTSPLPTRWLRTDEWYNFASNPRPIVHVLATIDETSYAPGADAMGDHPIAWCRAFDGGRTWYTASGHRAETWADATFRAHLLGGILSVAGAVDAGACGGSATPVTTTTSTTLPPGQPIAGTSLRLVAHGRRGATLGVVGAPINLSTATRGRLVVTSSATTVAFELSAPGWRRRGGRWIHRGPGARVRTGRTLRIDADAPALRPLLASDPTPVSIVLEIGAERWCLVFAGSTRFEPGQRLRAGTAAAPPRCP